jgi:peptide/nickel transport system substrate-binding protein
MRPDQIVPSRSGVRPTLTFIAMIMVVALAAAACGSSSSNKAATTSTTTKAATPQSGGSLVVGIRAETNGWNPALDQWADTGSLVGSTVLEPLATAGADSGAKPWLAKSWYPNTTFDRWVIDLQTGVKFQDGEDFNADSVVLNINTYAKGPLSGLAIGPMFKDVKALNPTTVEVDLTQPWAAFPSSFLTGGSALMMAPGMINSANGGVNHPIGTGPFSFDSWIPGDTFTAKKNPTYWGGLDAKGNHRTGLPYLNQIQFKVITDDSTRTAALQNGDINMQYTTNASDATRLAGQYTVLKDWDTEQAFIMPNTAPTVGGKPNPLSNVHARQALAYATNASQIAKSIGAGVQVPSSPWAPTNVWGMPTNQNGYVSYDLAQAKTQVTQYDSDTGQSGLTFTLSGLPSVDDARTLQQLQAQWKQAGITVNIETLEQTAYITKIATGGYQAAFFRNYGYPDPDQDYYFWSSTTAKGVGNISINFTQYTTPALEKDVNTGRQNGYPNIRKAAYHDLVKQLNAGFTNIWLYSTPYSFIAQKKVQGLDAPGGPGTIPFGTYAPKTWWSDVWLQS